MASDGTVFLFAAEHPVVGTELFMTDGTDVRLVADLHPTGSSFPEGIVWLPAAGCFLFTADDGVSGREVWKVQPGSAPELVRDLNTGGGSNPTALTVAGGRAFFFATRAGGRRALYKTDGTTGGTVRVSDISLVSASAQFSSTMTAVGSSVFFEADDTVSGWELYVSDGTSVGTIQPVELVPGPNILNPVLRRTAFGSLLLFCTDSTYPDLWLWRSDGTSLGTTHYATHSFNPMGSWVTAGTQDFVTFPGGGCLEVYDRLGFSGSLLTNGYTVSSLTFTEVAAAGGEGFGIVDKGTASARVMALYGGLQFPIPASITQLEVVGAGATWILRGFGSGGPTRVWGFNSTAPSAPIFDVLTNLSGPALLFGSIASGQLYFTLGNELWASDGTAAGTRFFADIGRVAQGGAPTVGPAASITGGAMLAATTPSAGRELWTSNATSAGTAILADLVPGTLSSSPDSFVENGRGRIFFRANTPVSGVQMHCTDGFLGSTVQVTSGPTTSHNSDVVAAGPLVFWSAGDATNGVELWRSDGSPAGSGMVRDIRQGPNGSLPRDFLPVNGHLYFTANDGNGRGLWRSDSSTAGTVSIVPGPAFSPANLCWLGSRILFAGTDAAGTELWHSDGTTIGTVRLIDIVPGASSSSPGPLVASGDRVFFVATDGVAGRELWKTDGTVAGTSMVVDLTPGPGSSSILHPTAFRGGLLFVFDDGVHGREPWFTDGTAVGTTMLRDIRPGPEGSIPTSGAFMWSLPDAGRALFTAADSLLDTELWRTDGTAAGTVQHAEIAHVLGSSPEAPRLVGTSLLFAADDGWHGRELFGMASMAASVPFGTACAANHLATPHLRGEGTPYLGNSGYRLRLGRSTPGAIAILGFAFARQNRSIGGGCEELLLGQSTMPIVLDSNGQATVPIPVPFDTALRGFAAFSQAWVLDGSGPGPSGASLSNGLKVVLYDH